MTKRRMEFRLALSGCSVRHSNSGFLRIGNGNTEKRYIPKTTKPVRVKALEDTNDGLDCDITYGPSPLLEVGYFLVW